MRDGMQEESLLEAFEISSDEDMLLRLLQLCAFMMSGALPL
jgi:hypothetical protein